MRFRSLGAALAAGLSVPCSRLRGPALALLGLLAAGFFPVCFAAPCLADIVVLRDGKVVPKDAEVPAGGVPSDDEMERLRGKKLEPLGYDTVKLGGADVSPGMVLEVYCYDAWMNGDYKDGETNATSQQWPEAADAFRAAADALKGPSRQLALYRRALCLAEVGETDPLIAAIDELVGEFPKAYFMGDLQKRRAVILAGRNKLDEAQAALEKVITAPGMNRHALHDAEITKIYLLQYSKAGRDKAKWAAAETAFRDRLAQIERESAKEEVEDSRLRALVGIGRCLVFQAKSVEARTFFERVISSPTATKDASMLASAYGGLGDVLYAEASEAQRTAPGNPAQTKKAAELLDKALLHYLRVTEFYGEQAGRGEVLSACVNAAHAFAVQFTLSNDTDCEAAKHAMGFFQRAGSLMGNGAERDALNREYKEFKVRRDKACTK